MKPILKITGTVFATALLGISAWVYFHRTQSTSPDATPRPESATSADAATHTTERDSAAAGSESQAAAIATKHESEATSVSDHIRTAVAPAGVATFADRVALLRAIKTPLSDEEIILLQKYLTSPANAFDPEGENWLRNVMLDQLTAQPVLTDDLPSFLIALYRDTAQDPVVRDYALQHMTGIYNRVDEPHQMELQNTLWQAVAENDSSIGGTAMLSLLDISESAPSVDKGRLGTAALKHAGDDNCGELTRITAVQMCGRLKVEAALNVIEGLAQTSSSQTLQNAAIAALGDFATEDAVKLLKRLSVSPNGRQAQAARLTLERLAQAAARAKGTA